MQFAEPRTLQRMFENMWNLPEQLRLRADAIGEQQLKRTQSGSNSSAKRAVQRQITHGRRSRGE